MKLCAGKTALVTGASRGVGKAISCALAREGCNLVLVTAPGSGDDLRQVEACCKTECRCECQCFEADLSDFKALEDFCKKCANQKIDVLVNNAGVFGSASTAEQGPLEGNPDEWEKMMRLNLMAPMHLVRHFGPSMAEKGEGWIINIGDVEGVHCGPHHCAYAASKHGLRGFGLCCYEALRDKNIKVMNIQPGNVKGTGMAATGKGEAGQGFITPEDVAEACMLGFRMSPNAVPCEITLKAVKTSAAT